MQTAKSFVKRGLQPLALNFANGTQFNETRSIPAIPSTRAAPVE
jgi:hypothetical protein